MAKAGGRGKGAKRGVRGTRSGMAGKGRTNAQIKRNPDGSFAKKGTGQVRMAKPKTIKAKSKSAVIKGAASAVIAAKSKARKPITAAKRKKLTKQGTLESKVGAIQQRKRAFDKKYKAKLAVEKVKRTQRKLRAESKFQKETMTAEGYKAKATKKLKSTAYTPNTIAKPKSKPKAKSLINAPVITKGQSQAKAKIKASVPTPKHMYRKADIEKIKEEITLPQHKMEKAYNRAFKRSARDAALLWDQRIRNAKRKGITGFGTGSVKLDPSRIKSKEYNWTKAGQVADRDSRLRMWKREARNSAARFRNLMGEGLPKVKNGRLKATRRAENLVSSGDRIGRLPTTRRLALEPRQRRLERIQKNLISSDQNYYKTARELKPKINNIQHTIRTRVAEGKKPTKTQLEKEQRLISEYNKAVRSMEVAKAAKDYMDNRWGYTPRKMSGKIKY